MIIRDCIPLGHSLSLLLYSVGYYAKENLIPLCYWIVVHRLLVMRSFITLRFVELIRIRSQKEGRTHAP